MFSFLFALLPASFGLSQQEIDKLALTPSYLSDFVNARQLRNLTIAGANDLSTVSSMYFTKTMFNLIPTLNPTYFELRSLIFNKFDGMIINGKSHGLSKVADVFIYNCQFNEGSAGVIDIQGPSN